MLKYDSAKTGFIGPYEGIPLVDSMNSLLSILHSILGCENGADVWYRGQRSSRYDLTPSLYRETGVLEGDTIQSWRYHYKDLRPYLLRLRAALGDRALSLNDSELVYLAQHYGIPTPLLDWSRSPLVACWFALNDFKPIDSFDRPVLYMLDPKAIKINWFFANIDGADAPLDLGDSDSRSLVEQLLSRAFDSELSLSLPPVEMPLALQSKHDAFARIARQSGCFTISGPQVQWPGVAPGLVSLDGAGMHRAIIPIYIDPDSVPRLLEELGVFGVCEETVYGERDFDRVAARIADSFRSASG